MATKRKPVSNPKGTVCCYLDRHAAEMAHVAGASLDSIAERSGTPAHPLRRESPHRHFRDHLDEAARAPYLCDIPLAELSARAAKEGLSLLDYFALVRSTIISQMLIASAASDGNRTAVLAGRASKFCARSGAYRANCRSDLPAVQRAPS
jgi:hypothetical protein